MELRANKRMEGEVDMKYNCLWISMLSVVLLVAIVGCETTPVQQGAVVGGALGAGAGAIIGNQSHHRSGEGALIGGAVGALGGALVGDQVDKNRQKAAAPPPAATQAERGHYETRLVKSPNGETYEERVWVVDK